MLNYPTRSWSEGLMPFLDRYLLEVYKTGGCIEIRPTKVIKMAAIQDGRYNFDLYRSE